MPIYIVGQWSNVQRKSVVPIALQTGLAPRTLQEFLSQHRWDCQRVRDRVQQIAVRETGATPERIRISDETSWVKKADKTPGVQQDLILRLRQ